MRPGFAVIGWMVLCLIVSGVATAGSPPSKSVENGWGSVSAPLSPQYRSGPDGAVTLRICFNWSCARREAITVSAEDMAMLRERIATCSGASLHDRLQRVRIGVWQMELLAQKAQPLLANDRAINDFEGTARGRMDCVDNSSNTTTYLTILQQIGALDGWTVSLPKVRDRFDLDSVHWTAVLIDKDSGDSWSVDSWFRPNGHLPMVMPLPNWLRGEKAWEPPFERLNSTPGSVDELCESFVVTPPTGP